MVAHRSHIAIIDDDPAMRQAVARLCCAADLPCRCYPSAEAFLSSESVRLSSLLILDIRLPWLSGFELLDRLEALGISLPVVIITGEDLPLYREKADRAGAVAFLTKPFGSVELISVVRRHLSASTEFLSHNTSPETIPHTP